MIQLEVYSELCPWTAPKFGRGHAYDPKAKEKEQLKWQLRAQYRGEIMPGPIILEFTFFFPIPKNTSGIKRRQMLGGQIVPMKKPDATNLQKALEDCLQGIVIENDCQVCDISTKRRYAEKPGALVRIFSFSEKYGGMGC